MGRWTKQEEIKLLENYINSSKTDLLFLFPHRKYKAICRKAANLGLKKSLRKKICELCGEIDSLKFDSDRYTKCKPCRNKRSRESKEKAVAYMGGKCVRCGYDRCVAGLDFHHTNPLEKDAQWGQIRHRNWEAIKYELDKCILVCKNCHAEIHFHREATVDLIEIQQAEKKCPNA